MIVVESDIEKIIDPKAAGSKFLGKGNEYHVYNGITTPDGMERVVKVPRKRWYYGILKPHPTREQAEEDYNIVNSYFNSGETPLFADTRFWGEDGNYRVLQEKILQLRNIHRRDMRDPKIAQQVQDALRRNGEMLRATGKSLGIIGQEGALSLFHFRPKITNMVLDTSGAKPKLKGTDFGLLRRDRPLGWLAIKGNAIVLNTLFGVNMYGEKTRSPFAPRIRRGR